MFDDSRRQAIAQYAEVQEPLRVLVEWGNFDMHNPHENWDMRQIGKRVFDEIGDNQKIVVTGGMVNDTTGWKSWQTRLDRVMITLVGRPE